MKGSSSFSKRILFLLYVVLQLCQAIHGRAWQKNHADSSTKKMVIDLGIDYNDEPVLDYFKNALANAITNDSATNMYGESRGDPQLRQTIGKYYSKIIGRPLNSESEIITTIGATEALVSTFRALSEPGDEWILIEPFFNMFRSAIELANAIPRYTSLKREYNRNFPGNLNAAAWELDRSEILHLINSKTRGIMFNNPNNPLGKTYTRRDLEFIAQLARKYNLLVISDEVHEFTTDSMIKMASLPGMFERTLTIGSASKAFCIPGWRIGWLFGPANLIDRINKVHGNTVNFVSTAQQRAVAMVFEDEYKNFGSSDTFLARNRASIKEKRQFAVQALRNAGMVPIEPNGGYCMLAGWPAIRQPYSRNSILRGATFADWMERSIGVHAYPADKYYGDRNKFKGYHRLRFCYHKSDQTLQNAAKHLLNMRTATGNLNAWHSYYQKFHI